MLEVGKKTLTIYFKNAYRVIRDEDGVPAKLLVSPQKLVLMTNPQPAL